MMTATTTTKRPRRPVRRLVAPSSAPLIVLASSRLRSHAKKEIQRAARWISLRPGKTRRLFDAQPFFAEVLDRARVERNHDRRVGLILEVEVLRFPVHPDHVFLLLEHRF